MESYKSGMSYLASDHEQMKEQRRRDANYAHQDRVAMMGRIMKTLSIGVVVLFIIIGWNKLITTITINNSHRHEMNELQQLAVDCGNEEDRNVRIGNHNVYKNAVKCRKDAADKKAKEAKKE